MKTVHSKGHIGDLHLNWKVERERIDNHMIWTLTVESWGLAEVRVKSYQLEPAEIDKAIVLMSHYSTPGFLVKYDDFKVVRDIGKSLMVITPTPEKAVAHLKSLSISEFLGWCPLGLALFSVHDSHPLISTDDYVVLFEAH